MPDKTKGTAHKSMNAPTTFKIKIYVGVSIKEDS